MIDLDSIDRLPLAVLPTPVQFCRRLTDHLGGPRIFVKRDDLTGAAGGGNKVRKLEYVLAEAVAAGADSVVSIGVTIEPTLCGNWPGPLHPLGSSVTVR